MRRVIYSTKAINEDPESVMEEVEEYDSEDMITSSSAADYMLQEDRDLMDFSLPVKSVRDLPEDLSFYEFCREFFGVVPDDLTDADYDSLYAKYDHYYDGWELRSKFRR